MKELVTVSNEVIFVLFLVILVIIGIARQSEGNRVIVFLKSFANTLLIEQQVRQERTFVRVASFSVLVSLLASSVFIAQLLQFFEVGSALSFGALYSLVIIGLLLFSAIRMAAYTAFSWLFEVEDLQVVHTFHWVLNSTYWALLLLPISIFFAFGNPEWRPTLIFTGLALGAILFIIRILRLLNAGISSFRIPLVYNIFYLCALEILPAITLILVIIRQEAN